MLDLHDSFGRRFAYVRLSLTEACNFKCAYCLPDGYDGSCANSPLNVSEISCLARGLQELGVRKIRLTGGEPTLRRDLPEVIRVIREAGINTIALTTNGYRLKEILPKLQEAGLTNLNVSVDSLDRETFRIITRQDRLEDILRGIELAFELGFPQVKVNSVLLKGLNDQEIPAFEAWTQRAPVHIRFIELMRTKDNAELFQKRHLSTQQVQDYLERQGWTRGRKTALDGPAMEYKREGFLGSLGLIAPYSKDFCSSCNRLRVSSAGALKLCLFGDGEHSLRPLLQQPSQKPELQETVVGLLMHKESSHHLHEGKFGSTRNLASIGG